MIIMNKKMKKQNNDIIDEKNSDDLNKIITHIVKNTKLIKEAVIFDEDGINESDVDFDEIFSIVNDWTGYEIGCNEIRIENRKFESHQYSTFARILHESLKEKYPDKHFLVYLMLDNDYVEIRFHILRNNEEIWISNDLNTYDTPILCVK